MPQERLTPEWHEARKGLYLEEVVKLVDGVVEDIKAGYLKFDFQAISQLQTHITRSSYVTDTDMAVECLRYSPRAVSGLQKPPYIFSADEPFPWLHLALAAMLADCWIEMAPREEFKTLTRLS